MKLIPFAMLFATAIFCSTLRNRIDPTPTPLPTLGGVPTPARAETPSPIMEQETSPTPASANSVGTTVSGGVLNEKAILLPKPDYPRAARAVRASGVVAVQILVDERGIVSSATAVSGHPLLKMAAVEAAKKAIFEPTVMSGKTYKLSGTLTFNFELE